MSIAEENTLRAIALKLASVFLFVVMAALIKFGSTEVPPGQAVFFRSFFAIPVILLWLTSRRELTSGLRMTKPSVHLIRGMLGTTTMWISFAGLALLPLSEVKAIQYVVPVFVVVLAAIFLGERIRLVRMAAVAMGLFGVLIILWPRIGSFSGGSEDSARALGAVLVLTSSVCAAFAQIFVRRMIETEETAAIVFWFSLSATCLSLVTMPFGWVLPSAGAVLALMLAGFLGGAAQILLTSAYRYSGVSVIAPFEYTSMLIAVAIGYAVFDEIPTVQMFVGAAFVIAAGVLIVLRERQLRLRRGKARQLVSKYG